MGQINKSHKYKVCFFTGILIGVILGVSALSVLVSYRMDQYYQDVAYLKNMIEDKNARLEKLENTLDTNTKDLIIEEIEVYLIFDGDEMDKIDLEKSIKEKYSTLLGKEVKNIDAELTVEVLNNRIMKIEDREYKIAVTKLIVTETLKIWINVERLGS